MEEEGSGWAVFFFLSCGGFLVATVEVDACSAMAKVAMTVAVGFCGGCFYIILKYCIYYFKWSGKNIEHLINEIL